MPARVLRHDGVEVGRDEAEVRGRQLPLERVAVGVAERLELREVGADRLLQRLARLEVAARKGPRSEERLARSLPEQHLQPALANLQHDRQRDVCRALSFGSRSRVYGHW